MVRHNIPEDRIERIFKTIVGDSESSPATGEIEYTSFIAACLDQRNYHEQSQLYQAFHRFQDASGSITTASLRQILGTQLSVCEVEQMVRAADLNGDGKIGWTEFCFMMSNRLPVARVAWRVVPLFHDMSADEVAQIMQLAVKRKWLEGEDIISEAQLATSLYLIEAGQIEVSLSRKTEIARPRPHVTPGVVESRLRRALSSNDLNDLDANDLKTKPAARREGGSH